MNAVSLLWLRRDLRLHDHAALAEALAQGAPVQALFIFDSDILAQFPAADDRRLSFIAAALCRLHGALVRRGGGLLVLHGRPQGILPALAGALGAKQLSAGEDYEPEARRRDREVAAKLATTCHVRFVKDQVVFAPTEILRQGAAAFKVFTPYSRQWKEALTPALLEPFAPDDAGRYADFTAVRNAAAAAGLAVLDASAPAAMLKTIGYQYADDALWPVDAGQQRLADFISRKARAYKEARDFMAQNGTSRLSPYIRFGLVSARECAKAAVGAGAEVWLNELIWRDFYAMTLYHAPESAQVEWNPKYRGTLAWSHDAALFAAWAAGKTGYPLVDAAMRQLLQEGWMHNRARMVVASFLTKHLRIDWRMGEAHFAQLLMDYDLASNVGGWQWAASTGTDAQPYFRVFNPALQSERFDPKGDYIRRYVPELKDASDRAIHAPWAHGVAYTRPVVVHEDARAAALAMFRQVP